MWEKFKTVCLIFLIITSILLTYRLWFSHPLLEEGTVPRYEYVYFTPPPSVYEIVQPVEVIFFSGDKTHLFRRGDSEYQRLWAQAWQVLTQKANLGKIRRNSNSELETALETATCRLVFPFHPALPLAFISDRQVAGDTKISKITFLWAEENYTVFLEGEEIFSLSLPDAAAIEALLPVKENPCIPLPSKFIFNADAGLVAMENDEGLLEERLLPNGSGSGIFNSNTASLPPGSWEINVSREIFVETGALLAQEISLERKNIGREELVKAFFLDLSLARRIEEKDGAVYFTDGEKGLRIYASGLVEYTAPRPENSFRRPLSYDLSLQKGVESQSIYGGFLPGTFLYDVQDAGAGCRMIWRRVINDLVLEGENAGCEILLEGQDVSFLRRNFLLAGTEIAARRPFRPFTEALCQALLLQQERLQEREGATLLSLRPVYYLPTGNEERAIPAWAVNFAETGTIYLHWSSLEPL